MHIDDRIEHAALSIFHVMSFRVDKGKLSFSTVYIVHCAFCILNTYVYTVYCIHITHCQRSLQDWIFFCVGDRTCANFLLFTQKQFMLSMSIEHKAKGRQRQGVGLFSLGMKRYKMWFILNIYFYDISLFSPLSLFYFSFSTPHQNQ